MFYVLEQTVSFGEIVDVHFWHKPCPRCGWSAVGREGGITVRLRRTSELVPIVWTDSRLALTEYAIRTFRKAGITGWEVIPGKVKLRHKKLKRKVPTYYEVQVTGSGGSLAHNKGVEIERSCPECGSTTYKPPTQGIHVDENQWDGSDIFTVRELPGDYLVTEKFHQMVRSCRLRGVELIPASEWRDPWGWPEGDRRNNPQPERPEYTFDIVNQLRRRGRKKGG